MRLVPSRALHLGALVALPLLGGCWDHPTDSGEDPRASLVTGVAAAPSPGSGAVVMVAAHEGGDRLAVLGTSEDGRVRLQGAVWSSGDSVVTVWLDPQSGLPEAAVIDGSLFLLRDWNGSRVAVTQLTRDGAVRFERDVATDWPSPGAAPARTLAMSEALAGAANAVGTVVCLRASVVRVEGSQLCARRGLVAFADLAPAREQALLASFPGFEALGTSWGCRDAASCGQRLVSDLYAGAELARGFRESLAPGADLAVARLRLMGTWRLTHVSGLPYQADAVVDQLLFSFSADGGVDRAQQHSRDVLGCFWREPLELEALTATTMLLLEKGVQSAVAFEFADGRLLTTHADGSARRYDRVSSAAGPLEPTCVSRPASLTIQSGSGQTGELGQPLSQPLVARVLDRRGAPVPGVPVTFQARPFYGVGDDGRLTPSAVTNALGIASASWQLSTRGEHNHAVVSVPDPALQTEATACAAFAAEPLQLRLNSVDRRTGVVEVGGTDSKRPQSAPRWDWGDGQKTTGFFPQTHVYATSGVAYRVEVTSEYCDGTRQVEAITVNARVEDFTTLDGALWRASQHELGRGWVRPANVSHADARVSLALSRGAYDGSEIRSTGKYQYGSYEARMRTPRAPGSLSAFFLYESNPGLDNDEIDIEIYNDGSGRVDFTTWVGGVMTNTSHVMLPFDPGAAFHDYRIEWGPGSVRFVVDGLTRAHFTTRVPTRAMHVFSNAWWPTWLNGPFLNSSVALVVDRILY